MTTEQVAEWIVNILRGQPPRTMGFIKAMATRYKIPHTELAPGFTRAFRHEMITTFDNGLRWSVNRAWTARPTRLR